MHATVHWLRPLDIKAIEKDMNKQVKVKCNALPIFEGLLCLLATLGCSDSDATRRTHFEAGGAFFGVSPDSSPDGQSVLYATPRTGSGDLYVMHLDSMSSTRITGAAEYECDGAFSPDGERVAFIREDKNAGVGRIWILNLQTNKELQLTSSSGDEGGPRFSPDGRYLAFWRALPDLRRRIGESRSREIFIFEIETGKEERVTDNEVEDVFPCFSPDGAKIAFSRETEIWTLTRLGLDESTHGRGTEPSFSLDGKQIICVAGEFGRQLDLIDVGTNNRIAIVQSKYPLRSPSFLPDQSHVLFFEQSRNQLGDVVSFSIKSDEILPNEGKSHTASHLETRFSIDAE
jgi:Tol biopolymer transport system component